MCISGDDWKYCFVQQEITSYMASNKVMLGIVGGLGVLAFICGIAGSFSGVKVSLHNFIMITTCVISSYI